MRFVDTINSILLPAKLLVPQPIIAKIPYLTTNEDIRLRKALEWLDGHVLDIGCGNNRLIQEYRRRGGRGLGVDVHDWRGQDLIVADTSHLPFDASTFDTVTMIACINHVPNRGDVLREVHRILKSQGRLVFTNLTPSVSWIWHHIAFWDADQHERGMKHGEVWGLSGQDVRDLVTSASFVIKVERRFSWGLNTIYRCRKRWEDCRPPRSCARHPERC